MTLTLITLSGIVGGLLYRLRGSEWLGTFKQRLLWCAGTGLLVFGLSLNPLASVAVALGAYAALMIPHGKFYRTDTFNQLGAMVLIGLARAVLYGLPLLLLTPHALAVIIAGGLHGPAYRLGAALEGKLGVNERTQWGEMFTGFYIWASIAAVLA